jgi:DNA-binding NarL/FixJ family response regulator
LTLHFTDQDIRARFFTSPTGRELRRLAAMDWTPEVARDGWPGAVKLTAGERDLLLLLAEGRTNEEIARELSASADEVSHRLAGLYAKMGANSRADATSRALMGRLI